MAIIKVVSRGASLKHIIEYVTRSTKTDEHLVTGIDCDSHNAYDDMMLTKEVFGKVNGRQYKHFIYSFPPDEKVTPEQVLENAEKLVKETPALQGYQALIAVHEDRKHLHAHIIINSVHCETGIKVQWSKADLADLKKRCNELSKEQGLSIPVKGQSQDHAVITWTKAKQQALSKAMAGKYKSYYFDMAKAVSICKSQAVSREDFIERMSREGLQVCWSDSRKHITFVDAEGHKVRDSNFEKTMKIACTKEALETQFVKNAEQTKELHPHRHYIPKRRSSRPSRGRGRGLGR